MSYTKLFSEIIMSTVWREPDHVRLVWITMLALRNRWHIVEASLPGLADAARVTLEQCQEAINILSSPDPYSRSVEDDGRRIRKADGGWYLINGEKYRNKMSLDERREYNRIKKRESRQKLKEKQDMSTQCQQSSGHSAQTEKEYSNTTTASTSSTSSTSDNFNQPPIKAKTFLNGKKVGEGPHYDLVRHFHALWSGHAGCNMEPANKSKDLAHAKRVLKSHTLEELQALAYDYFDRVEQKWWNFAHFCSTKSRLMNELSAEYNGEASLRVGE